MAAVPPDRGAAGPVRTRNANYRSTIYKDKHGRWIGRVTMDLRDNGRSDRRHVRGATRAEVARKVRALERERDNEGYSGGGARFVTDFR
jgi:integrase